MSEYIVKAMNDLDTNVSFGGGGGGGGGRGIAGTPIKSGRDAAYYGGAATVCAAGGVVTRGLASSPATKNPVGIAATVVSGVVTFAACSIAGDAVPRKTS